VSDIYDDILSSLKDQNLIEYFSISADLPAPDPTMLIKLTKFAIKMMTVK
jgi:hypothetical protein